MTARRLLIHSIFLLLLPIIIAWFGVSVPGAMVLVLLALVLRFLMRKAFGITEAHYRKSVEHIETIVADIDLLLADGRTSITGGQSINFADITFASLSSLWVQPPEFGKGKADQVRVDPQLMPAPMKTDTERWIEEYPDATGFIRRLYVQERGN